MATHSNEKHNGEKVNFRHKHQPFNTIMSKVRTIKIKRHQIGIDPIMREQNTEKNNYENYGKGRGYNTTKLNTIN